MPPKNKKGSQPPSSGSTALRAQARISWPQLGLPSSSNRASHLTLEPLLPSQIYLIRSFFPQSLCNTYTRFLSMLPLVTTPSKTKRGEAVRVNDRFQIEDASFAKELWISTGLAEVILGLEAEGEIYQLEDQKPTDEQKAQRKAELQQLWGGEVVGLNPNIRIYRYGKGQFFDKHYDDSNVLHLPLPTIPGSPQSTIKLTKCHTTYTLLLYLTAPPEVIGGETVFYNPLGRKSGSGHEVIRVGLEKGMALLHKHGKDCLLHEGAMVTEGEKWVLRTDLVVRS
ncbi:hypothetical protein BDZ91DRAFT_717997 [Kalaharituber pfeilii]|nr:hypothetical protein BDZ91DRAFT_717997 [Kalaharituber pfeilii]